MHDLYDRLENRTPAAREGALFRDLCHVLAVSKSRVPALRAQLKGIDVGRLRTRADLTQIPIRRRSDLLASQTEAGWFGGYAATRVAALAQVFAEPSALLSLAGNAKDWWGMARALYAAGLRKGSLVLNCLPYDLVPYGHMIESGARAIGCPVIPAGNAAPDQVAAVVARLTPRFFCGTAAQIKAIIDSCGLGGESPFERALLMGKVKPGLREELRLRGVSSRQALMLPEFGVVAYESGTSEGLVLAEGYLLEIVDPISGTPVAAGSEGEIVLSRINVDYPLLRYGTGLTSIVLEQASTCGRTNVRIKMPNDPCDAKALSLDDVRKDQPDYNVRRHGSVQNGASHPIVDRKGDDEPPVAEERAPG